MVPFQWKRMYKEAGASIRRMVEEKEKAIFMCVKGSKEKRPTLVKKSPLLFIFLHTLIIYIHIFFSCYYSKYSHYGS